MEEVVRLVVGGVGAVVVRAALPVVIENLTFPINIFSPSDMEFK